MPQAGNQDRSPPISWLTPGKRDGVLLPLGFALSARRSNTRKITMPRNCHPSWEFHPSGLTGARDTMAMQLGDGKSKVLKSFDPTAEETLFIPRLQGG
jgi:hypothetical protein